MRLDRLQTFHVLNQNFLHVQLFSIVQIWSKFLDPDLNNCRPCLIKPEPKLEGGYGCTQLKGKHKKNSLNLANHKQTSCSIPCNTVWYRYLTGTGTGIGRKKLPVLWAC